MILFNAEAIFASRISNFGKYFPQTDREDFNSCNDSTTSTSLIHNNCIRWKIRTVVNWFLNRIFRPKGLEIMELAEMQFRNVLSLLPNHRILRKFHRHCRVHSRRPSCKCRHWNCVSTLFVISCEKSLRPCSLWNWSSFSWRCARVNSLMTISDWIKRRKLITKKKFSYNPDVFHVSRGRRFSRLSKERELGIIEDWRETRDNLPLFFDSTSWNSPESFIEFTCSCMSCNWEVSFCIVSWFCFNFCTETSSARSSWALCISPTSCMLGIWVSRRTFSFIDKSSCSQTWSRRNSLYPCWASCNSNLWA